MCNDNTEELVSAISLTVLCTICVDDNTEELVSANRLTVLWTICVTITRKSWLVPIV